MSTIIPEFYQEWITSTKSESEIDNFFCSAEWITNELTDQIYTYVPQLGITTDKINLSSIKSKDCFERNCNILFPEKRKFMNYRQLNQFITLFLDSWSKKIELVSHFLHSPRVRECATLRVMQKLLKNAE